MAARRSRAAASHQVRIERDRLGALAVPADALWGIQTARALRNLSFSGRSLGDYPSYVKALATVKIAAARANRDAGVLDPRRAAAIETAGQELRRGAHLDQFPADPMGGGGSIAINMNINEVIAGLANLSLGRPPGADSLVHPIRHVNASQSTADVCHTAARLAILERFIAMRRAMVECAAAYRKRAAALGSVITVARTCLRDAAPEPLGAMLGGHASAIARRAGALEQRMLALRQVNLGGTAIGSGRGAPPKYRRAILRRLNELAPLRMTLRPDLRDAAQNIDDLGAAAAELGLLAEVLLKIADDLRLLASGPAAGFGEIVLPAVMEGSSFFPGKINPVVAETLMQCCFAVLGCERTARAALEHGELNLNVFENAAALSVIDALAMFERALALFTRFCVSGIAADRARCAALVRRVRGASK